MKILWDEENEDDLEEDTQKERLLEWNRYLWNKLANQKLPERSKISSVLMIRSLLYRAEKLGIDVVTNPQCVKLKSQLPDRVDKLLNGFKKYKKMYRVRLKLGGQIVRHELYGKIPEYCKPGEIVALERSRRNMAEERIKSKASKRLKASPKKSHECTCKCTDMNQAFVQCDRGNGWWCLRHAKLTANQAETIESWVCPNCSRARKKKRPRPTNATLGISELFDEGATKKRKTKEDEMSYPVLSQEALVRCPRCKGNAFTQGLESKMWLCCDRCERWIHAECDASPVPANDSSEWYCEDCIVPCEDTAFYFDRKRRGKRVKVYLKVDGVRILKKNE